LATPHWNFKARDAGVQVVQLRRLLFKREPAKKVVNALIDGLAGIEVRGRLRVRGKRSNDKEK
jgi:hypothetical protein